MSAYVYDRDGRPYKLPAAAEGHVARRFPREMPADFMLPPGEEPEEPIDSYDGPVWVGGLCFVLLAGALIWCALWAFGSYIVEVLS